MFGTNKRAVESFVVAKQGQTALAASATLYNSSTGNVSLNNGQFGFVATSPYGTVAANSFTDATPVVTEAPVLALFQGNANSGALGTATAKFPLWVRPYERTADMDGRIGNLQVTKQAYAPGTYSIWQIGTNAAGTATDKINITDKVQYQLQIVYRGRRSQLFYGVQEDSTTRAYMPATDFTALGLSGELALDYIATKLVIDINRNSQALTGLGAIRKGNDPVVAFLMAEALSGPSGAAAGVAVSSLTAGTVVTVSTVAGVNQTITLTQEMADSLIAAAASSGFTHIVTASDATQGTATGGTGTGIWIMAVDERTAYLDYIAETKVALEVGFVTGLASTVRKVQLSKAFEGMGYGTQLEMFYQATQGQRKYWGRHREVPVVNFPSDIDTTLKYVTYIVENGRVNQVDTFNLSHSPLKEIILIPAYSTGTTTNPFIATFDTAFNGWLTSGGNSSIVSI